ncbi:hypothetical protein [Paenibacillus sp. YAF4_2]|uniref:hypothetical protein n=1 Tax=Paenibacillus sp. YAF4_2 TaxID=3233085 RepID=UPI003F9DD4EF
MDNEEEVEEAVLPGEIERFQIVRNILAKTLDEYIKDYASERISRSLKIILNNLQKKLSRIMNFVLASSGDQKAMKIVIYTPYEMIGSFCFSS